jgi:hypothetical protein
MVEAEWYRAAALAGEDWQKRTRISFTLRDRLARHAIAAGCSRSIRFVAAGCCFLSAVFGK